MDGKDHSHQQSDAASTSSGGGGSSNNSVSGPEDNTTTTTPTTAMKLSSTSTFQPPEIDSAAKARVNNGGTATGITNSGRWSNEEHERFLTGLEQFG